MPRSTNLTPLSFGAVQFNVVDQNGVPWLQAREIGKALGYSRPDALLNLFDRNKTEFNQDMTRTIELMVGGQTEDVRIFSPRGCHLLGMFARTDNAKAFRRWVLDVLDSRVAEAMAARGPEQPRRFPGVLRLGPQCSFNGTPLHPVMRAGVPWFGATEIARALDYATPATAITKVYNRHRWDIPESETAMGQVGDFVMRIFSPRACFLLARFSHSPLTDEFQAWLVEQDPRAAEPLHLEPGSPGVFALSASDVAAAVVRELNKTSPGYSASIRAYSVDAMGAVRMDVTCSPADPAPETLPRVM